MEAVQALAGSCRIATAHDLVLNSECCFTFHSPFTSLRGIVVNLQTFMGTVEEMAMQQSTAEQGIFVRIAKERILKPESEREEEKAPTKLAIGVEGGFLAENKYDTISKYSVVVLQKNDSGAPTVIAELPFTDETKTTFPEMVIQSVDAIIHHTSMTTTQDVKQWQLDADEQTPVSKYAADLPFVDNGVMIDPIPSNWNCQKSGDTENLWLNLSDGYIGGGRRNWDGSGGSNGALDHFEETGKKYPLVVKLGTITADPETADCYSYAPDEDGPVKIPNLAELLEKRGIKIASMQKTVKSTAELEVELNANYAFDAITESGAELTAVSGPGLQGLVNLGNSCYMNSIVQMLFSLPELTARYGTTARGSVTQHPFLTTVAATDAPNDLLCQTSKVACALTSGVFAKRVTQESDETDPKYRLAPRMLKHVVGRDHVEFRTGQQQDAAQFLQYYLEKLDRAELGKQALLKKTEEPVRVASHLFQFQTTARMVCSADSKIKYKESAPESIWSLRLPMDKAVVIDKDTEESKEEDVTSPEQKRLKADEDKKPVPTLSFSTCVEEWAADTQVDDIRWPHLQNARHPAQQRTRLGNFPRYLIVQIQRYTLGPDWSPIKLEVKLDIPEEIDLSAYKSSGPQEGENLVPDEEEEGPSGGGTLNAQPVVDEAALAQLMDMGFSLNSCKRALTAVGGSDVEAAMGWVFEHNTDPDFNDPLPEPMETEAPAGSSDSGVDEGVVQSLVETLGCFTADQVRAALKETNGAADRAADWLFSHMDDLDGAIAALQSKEQQPSVGPAPSVPLEDGEGKYTMIGMVSHIGKNTGSGHYVAHLKKDGKWVIFNDEKVALSHQPPYEHAYLYLFQRSDTFGSPDLKYLI